MSSYLLDANIIIRLLTGEPEDHYEAAKAFLEIAENGNREVYIEPLVMAEVIFVLTGKVYELDRKLATFDKGIANIQPETVNLLKPSV